MPCDVAKDLPNCIPVAIPHVVYVDRGFFDFPPSSFRLGSFVLYDPVLVDRLVEAPRYTFLGL